jgi:hypothetical protein
MEGDDWHEPVACENFDPHPDLCPEPDSGPWYCSHNPKCNDCGKPYPYSGMTEVTEHQADGTTKQCLVCEDCKHTLANKARKD